VFSEQTLPEESGEERKFHHMRKLRILLTVVLSAGLFLSLTSGGFLVVNNPQPADVIVVLAGETDRRPALGLELLSKGLASRMLLDVPADAKIYQWSMLDLSQQYIQKLPQAESVLVCPISGRSTKAEAQDVLQCLQKLHAHSVLVVTSDYHTRRALSTFQHELPGYQVSVAAASDPQQFGGPWWQHRQWAKLNFDEWLRLVWWQGIDRWRR
jgi:uncharacterized SAM-binding protein YcdF (DUF218 family)